jgi:HAD superfamily hydrolase (TIGR01459 family)
MQQEFLTQVVNGMSELVEKYDAFVLDQWGVIHDGNAPYPGVEQVLTELKRAGKPGVVLTNSSKTATVNERRLTESFGIDRALYQCVVSSAEVTINWLQQHGPEFFGTRLLRAFVLADGTDAVIVEASSLIQVHNIEHADFVLLLSVDPHQNVELELEWSHVALRNGLPLVCASMDQLTVTPGGVFPGLRGMAARYMKAGGRVLNFGKPERYVYEICEANLKGIHLNKVLAVGDQLESDISGAKRFGFDAALVRTGAAATEFPSSLSTVEVREKINIRSESGLLVPDWLLPGLVW